mmetsp:Transcript_37952/g.83209  ORF Transcript_37952/g.83209 Transcript_37952/m.83209 type:complete len:657 (-) Transcript_37952:215-2185(-)
MTYDKPVPTFGVPRTDLKQLVRLHLNDVAVRMWNQHIRDLEKAGTPFASDTELPMYAGASEETAMDFIEFMIGKLEGQFESKFDELRQCATECDSLNTSKGLLELFFKQVKLQAETVGKVYLDGDETASAEVSTVGVLVHPYTDKCFMTCPGPEFAGQPVPSVALNKLLRDKNRDPTAGEYFCIYFGYVQVTNGVVPDYTGYRFHGTSGFRKDAQTYCSLTDPGDGHCLEGTWITDNMKGAIVHVEWLERPKAAESRDMIESYRISSYIDFIKVRTHVSDAAPTTWFVGRPLKDSGDFGCDFLKVVHTTAAALSAAFAHGAAECKCVMEGLTASQMLRYMTALSQQLVRNRARQYVSAAFPLNTPLVDDREETKAANGGEPVTITDKYEIGKLGVVLAAEGGFDKVTFDGAGDVYPSVNILEQLGHPEAVDLIHRAHERGLITYYSAGFKIKDDSIAKAVLTGTDGIGIGGAQVLRHMDHTSGMHGPYQPENLPIILGLRNAAQETLLGRGVHLLCRMDRMFFEGTLDAVFEPKRDKLLQALQTKNEPAVETLMSMMSRIVEYPDDGETPMMGYFNRVLTADNPLVKIEAIKDVGEHGWSAMMKKIKILMEAEDENELYEVYRMAPWATWKDACHVQKFGGAARMKSKLVLGKVTN